jgi:hypothetical protein
MMCKSGTLKIILLFILLGAVLVTNGAALWGSVSFGTWGIASIFSGLALCIMAIAVMTKLGNACRFL